MKAAIYARVSTEEQTRGHSLPAQLKECRQYAERHGMAVAAELKENVSGVTRLSERDTGGQILELAEMGQIDALVVWRLDRLSRPPEDELSRLLTTIEHLARLGVAVHECESGQVKNDMASIFMAFFKGVAASKERADIAKRMMLGKREKAREGKLVQGGTAPYGYRIVGKGRDARLEIHEEEAATVRRMFDLFTGKDGRPVSLRALSRMLNSEGVPPPGHKRKDGSKRWAYNHIGRRIIKHRRYIGEFSYDGIDISRPDLAIIDMATWRAAQRRMADNKKRARHVKPGNVYLLSGRAECVCGMGLTGHSVTRTLADGRKRRYAYYRCVGRHHYGTEYCDAPIFRVDHLDGEAWEWLVRETSSDERIDELIAEMVEEAESELSPLRDELATVTAGIKQADRHVKELMASFGNDTNETLRELAENEIRETAELLESLQRQRDGLKAKIARAEISPAMRTEIKALARLFRQRLKQGGTDKDKLALMEALNVQAQLEHTGGGRYLMHLSCGLGNEPYSVCISDRSPA